MIALIGASAIIFTALQASINAPTQAFRGCLKTATAKATETKVAPDGIEDFFKNECRVEMESLKSAVVAFRVKNGMARKTAIEDANMTVEDYMAAPADRYRFVAEMDAAPAKAEAKPPQPAPAQPTPAAQPKN
jgi:uncharacterized protein YqfA (UPF0365 family)